ncbi:MAG: hypothetical protein FRX48_09097 [Lasallia pustulata]|uniref:Polysaccharide chain length determinant N-terminal domain-containing protein n=1 Tax=Lasallia pustulata TaxID=136370 RepID=A0A5M8PCR4_9LECA|nr:MAG: hypothetical protein FRX48_09097 [Lasallia pustulata]
MNDIHSANYQTETSLSDVARALWRRKWIILLVVPLFVVAAYFYTQRLPKQWQADAQLLVVQRPDYARRGHDQWVHPPAPESISTQIAMLHTPAMADRALSWLKNQELITGLTYDTGGATPGSLQGSLSASSPSDSSLSIYAIANIQAEISGEQATVDQLKGQLEANNHSLQTLGPRDDALTTGLSSQLSGLRLQRQALARKVTPAFPGQLPVLDAEIKDLENQYKKAVAATQNPTNPTLPAQAGLQSNYQAALTQLNTSKVRLAAAEASKNEAEASIAPLVQTGSVYERIAGQAQSATAYYNGLEQDWITARLRENQINADVQITQPAVGPEGPPSLSPRSTW